MATNKGRFYKTFVNMRTDLLFFAIGIIINIFSRRSFLEYLGPNVVGLNATVSNLLGAFTIAEMGIFSAITFFLYKPLEEKNYNELNTVLAVLRHFYERIGWIMVGVGIVLTAIIPYIFAHADIPWYYPYLTLWVMLSGVISSYFFTYGIVLFYGEQRTYKTTIIYEGGTRVKILVQIAVVYLIHNEPYLWWLLVEFLYQVFLVLAVRRELSKEYPWLTLKRRTLDKTSSLYRQIVTKIKQSFVYKLSIVVVNNASPIVVFSCLNLFYVTVFTNYLIISKMLTNINTMINSAIFAGIGNLILEKDEEKEKEVIHSFVAFMFFWGALISWGFYTYASEIISFLFGGQYVLPQDSVFLFSIMMYLMSIRCGPETCLTSQGIIHDVWAPIVHTVLYIGATVILGLYKGINGVLIGIILAELFMVLWKPFFLSQHKSFVRYGSYMLNVLWYVILTIVGALIMKAIPLPSVIFSIKALNIMAHLVISALLYLFVLGSLFTIGSSSFRVILRRGRQVFSKP